MNNNSKDENKSKRLSRPMKVFYLVIFFLSIYVIIKGFRDYKEIMDHPKIARGVVYKMELTRSGEGNYYWDVYYSYTIDEITYTGQRTDQSAFSKDYETGDSLYVYYSSFDPEHSLAFKNQIHTPIRPNLFDFMLRDSISGYLLLLVSLLIISYILPPVLTLMYLVLTGMVMLLFNKDRAKVFFHNGMNRLGQKTERKLTQFGDLWKK